MKSISAFMALLMTAAGTSAWGQQPQPQPRLEIPAGPQPRTTFRTIPVPTVRVEDVAKPVAWSYRQMLSDSTSAEAGLKREGPTVTYLGVSASSPSPELIAQLPVAADTSLIVDAITPGSAAEKAGIQPNDVLIKLDDQILIHPRQLAVLVANRKEGDTVKLTLLRKGQSQEISVVLGVRPNDASAQASDLATKLDDIDIRVGGNLQKPLRTYTRSLELSQEEADRARQDVLKARADLEAKLRDNLFQRGKEAAAADDAADIALKVRAQEEQDHLKAAQDSMQAQLEQIRALVEELSKKIDSDRR